MSAPTAAAERPLREISFDPSLKSLRRCDLEDALEFVHSTASAEGPAPLPPSVVEALAQLVRSNDAAYFEWDLAALREPIAEVRAPGSPTSEGIAEARYYYCATYPLSVRRLTNATRPCRLSDFVSPRAMHRLDYYDSVLRPSGIEHQIRLWLPAPAGFSRAFCFDRSPRDRDFGERECSLLQLLRPFLIGLRQRFAARATQSPVEVEGLTARENEILEWVSAGKTNPQIAALLVVSTHTVRKHLENVYAKLGVRTRTAAAARYRAPDVYRPTGA